MLTMILRAVNIAVDFDRLLLYECTRGHADPSTKGSTQRTPTTRSGAERQDRGMAITYAGLDVDIRPNGVALVRTPRFGNRGSAAADGAGS
jgi:hypothetical protein